MVAIQSWFWIDPASWEPLSERAEAGSVWAEVTITPQTLVIDPGDGSGQIECPSGGTPRPDLTGVPALFDAPIAASNRAGMVGTETGRGEGEGNRGTGPQATLDRPG